MNPSLLWVVIAGALSTDSLRATDEIQSGQPVNGLRLGPARAE